MFIAHQLHNRSKYFLAGVFSRQRRCWQWGSSRRQVSNTPDWFSFLFKPCLDSHFHPQPDRNLCEEKQRPVSTVQMEQHHQPGDHHCEDDPVLSWKLCFFLLRWTTRDTLGSSARTLSTASSLSSMNPRLQSKDNHSTQIYRLTLNNPGMFGRCACCSTRSTRCTKAPPSRASSTSPSLPPHQPCHQVILLFLWSQSHFSIPRLGPL